MPDRNRTRKPSLHVRRQLDVATAIATEELLAAHAAHVLELVDLARGKVVPERLIEIYLRLQGVENPQAMVVRTRVLAALGRKARSAPETDDDAADGPSEVEEVGAPPPRGIFSYLRQRFRGRVHNDLRRWVELHTGRSAVALLDIHVRNALSFVDILGSDWPIHVGVQTYREMLGVGEGLRDVLYWLVLERIGRAELPPTGALPLRRGPEPIPAPAPAPGPNRRPRLRPPYRTA